MARVYELLGSKSSFWYNGFMKKIIIGILTPLLLTGCLGGDDTNVEEISGSSLFEHSNFSILVPSDWETITSSDFTSNIPRETIVVFKNNIKSEIFTANVNVSATAIPEDIQVEDFELSSKAKAKTTLISFEELSSNPINISSGENFIEGKRLAFTGKKEASDPIIYFDQIFVIKGRTGYVVTSSSRLNEDETVVKFLDSMLNSFSLN